MSLDRASLRSTRCAAILRHLLSDEQVALYRVLTRDANRFPDLGRQYQKTFTRGRAALFIAYFRSVAQRRHWAKRDARQDAALYEAFLRSGIYEEVLLGVSPVDANAIEQHARSAAGATLL